MKQLLIEEMKRAIEILETKEEPLRTMKPVEGTQWSELDREVSELRKLLQAIRRHSVLLEKGRV